MGLPAIIILTVILTSFTRRVASIILSDYDAVEKSILIIRIYISKNLCITLDTLMTTLSIPHLMQTFFATSAFHLAKNRFISFVLVQGEDFFYWFAKGLFPSHVNMNVPNMQEEGFDFE